MAGADDIVKQALRLVMGGGDDAAESALRAFAETKFKTPQGKPMRLYHMTPADITEFRASPENRSGPAVFLSPYADYQPAYHQAAEAGPQGEITDVFKEGANVMPVYADVRNPLVLDHPRKIKEAAAKYQGGDREFPRYLSPEARAALEAEGYDGVILGGSNPIPYGDRPMDARLGHQEARDEEFLVFDPKRVKSAVSNTGEYDFSNPDITKAGGGQVREGYQTKGRVLTGLVEGAANAAKGRSNKAMDNALRVMREGLADLARQRSVSPAEIGKPFGDIIPRVPYEEWEIGYTPNGLMIPQKPFDPSTLKPGDILIPLIGDRTANSRTITSIAGKKLERPVVAEGGPDYMRGPAQIMDKNVWASDKGAITKLNNRVEKALTASREAGYNDPNAYGVYVAMGTEGGDFSTHTAEALMGMLPHAKILKKDVAEFDRMMKAQDKNWPGLMNPKAYDYVVNADAGAHRKAFVQAMDTGYWRDKGFPDASLARYATTTPDLVASPTEAAGYAVAKLAPEAPRGPVTFSHRTYNTPMPGEYAGTMPAGIMRDDIFTQHSKRFDENPPNTNLVMAKRRSFERNQNAYQLMRDQDIQNLIDFTNKIKNSYAYGGEVDDDDIDDALRIAKDVGGSTPVMMEDAKGNKYDAQGNIIPPTNPTGSSHISDPTLERKGMIDIGEPVNYETEVKPFIDVATSPMNWAVESPDSYSGFPLGIGTVQTEGPSLLDTMKIATQLAASGQPTEDRGEYNWGQSREKAVRRFVGAPEGGEEAPYRGPFSYNPSDTANYLNTLIGFSPVGWAELFHDIPYEAGRTGDYGTAAYEGGINAALSAPGIAALGLAGRAGINALRRNPKLAAGMIGSAAFVDPNEAEAGPARWFSKAMEVARALPMEKMTGQQALAMLRKGVSPEELKWTGADTFLPQQKQITKQDLVDYLAKNRVQTQDVVFGGAKPSRRDNVVPSETAIAPYKDRWDELVAQNRAINEVMLLPPSERDADIDDLLAQRNDIQYEMDQIHDKAVDATIEEMGGLGLPVRYGPGSQYGEKYVTRGGEGYRETLVQLPQRDDYTQYINKMRGEAYSKIYQGVIDDGGSEKLAQSLARRTSQNMEPEEIANFLGKRDEFLKVFEEQRLRDFGFKSQHWEGYPNVLTHIRSQMLDVMPPGANRPYKAFNVDEAQSDWAKAGRDKGFVTPEDRANYPMMSKQYDQLNAERRRLETDVRYGDDSVPEIQAASEKLAEVNRQMEAIANKMTAIRSGGVPVAPYVTGTQGWTDLSIKKALDQAMDAGADYFTYTPGGAQAKRYSLRNEVQGLAYDPEEKTLSFYPKDGRGWQDVPDAVPREDLKKYVGEEAAKKLLAQEPNALSGNHILEGVDLEFGGEGMIDYYDNIYKKRVEKVVKDATGKKVQWEVIPVQTADGPREQLGFRLTDDMKEARFSDFNKGGRVSDPVVNKALSLTANM